MLRRSTSLRRMTPLKTRKRWVTRKVRKPKPGDDPEWLADVRRVPCVICGRPAVPHHRRHGVGRGQKAPDCDTAALCPDHHTDGGFGECIHQGTKTFEKRYGSEAELIRRTTEAVLNLRARRV